MSKRAYRALLTFAAGGLVAAGCSDVVPPTASLAESGVVRNVVSGGGPNAISAPADRVNVLQGRIQGTGKPTDLAIQGDGFFVLSRVTTPKEASDLRFTRSGRFHITFHEVLALPSDQLGQGAAKGKFRLVNEEGLAVMGLVSGMAEAYELNAIPNLPGQPNLPKEFLALRPDIQPDQALRQRSTSFLSPGLQEVGDGFQLAAVEVPYQIDPAPLGATNKNVNSNFSPMFDAKGYLQSNYDAPSADTGNPLDRLVVFVAVAKLKDSSRLKQGETSGTYIWTEAAGDLLIGVAAEGTHIGKTNALFPGSLEEVE